jgi:hypothetical protein
MSAYEDQMNDDVTNHIEDAMAEDEGPPIKGSVTSAEESQPSGETAMEDEGPPIKGSTT